MKTTTHPGLIGANNRITHSPRNFALLHGFVVPASHQRSPEPLPDYAVALTPAATADTK